MVAFTAAGCDNKEQQAEAPPKPTVIVEKAEEVDLQSVETYTGRVEAKEKVMIMARVEGFLEERKFEEGSIVKKGDTIYTIEKDTYQIAVEQAEAALEKAKADELLSDQTFKRFSNLANKDVASKAKLDEVTAQRSAAKAAVKAAGSNLNNAKLNLSYTDVISPIDGKIGRSKISVGNLVSPASGPLVEIVQQNPVYVTFPVPQRRYLEVVELGKEGADSVYVELELGDSSTYNQKGSIAFASVEATQVTDSIPVRATFENPKGILVDQQVVYARIVSKGTTKNLMIPQKAMLVDQEGPYVMQIDKDNKVQITRIKIGETRGTKIVVQEGLKAGDQVIVDGHQKVRPDLEVETKEASGEDKSSVDTEVKK